MSKRYESTSKFLSFLLRHRPDAIGLSLDSGGWAAIDDLIDNAGRQGRRLTRPLIEAVVAMDAKRRFALSADGLRIRANQGHSIAVELGLAPVTPPETLYHGTAPRFIESIRARGLLPGSRRQVHLSATVETARHVGARHGRPVILTIRAAAMSETGHDFYSSDNGVWLTGYVPVDYIEFPDRP